ncbi:MAG: hypothetical protein KAS32_14360 [Candidatus Peribacteraceae bacterium]|nr:hypothetical protein [Candidatus Peribacteraceae bacterium]
MKSKYKITSYPEITTRSQRIGMTVTNSYGCSTKMDNMRLGDIYYLDHSINDLRSNCVFVQSTENPVLGGNWRITYHMFVFINKDEVQPLLDLYFDNKIKIRDILAFNEL